MIASSLTKSMWFPNMEQAELEAEETAKEIIRELGKEHVKVRIRDHQKRIQSEIDVSIESPAPVTRGDRMIWHDYVAMIASPPEPTLRRAPVGEPVGIDRW